MGYPRRLLTEDEVVVHEFRPHWRLLVVPLFWGLLGTAAIIVVWTVWDQEVVAWIVTAVAAVAIIWLAFVPFVQWWFRLYVLTNERLIRRSGVISREGLEIPLENINDIKFTQNILERVLRSGDLLVESAGEQGQSDFNDIPDPERFQSEVYREREARARSMESAPPDPASQLETLARLHRDGVLTDEEFAEKRQKLLDEV